MTFSGTFEFDEKDLIYKEHLPGRPVVPGVLIIKSFVQRIKEREDLKEEISIEDFSFKHFVSPGVYEFQIEECLKGDFVLYLCSLKKDQKVYVQGRILKTSLLGK